MTDRIGRADAIGANQDIRPDRQRIAMEAALVSVFPNVVGPPDFAARRVDRVEGPRARADENLVTDDRRGRVDSAARFEEPDNFLSG